jgi:hypothetical protein
MTPPNEYNPGVDTLAALLADPYQRAAYENFRRNAIEQFGYETFATLQHEAIKKLISKAKR